MLTKALRFHGHQTVRHVYRQGKAVHGSIGSLHSYTDQRQPKSRVAVVVSKKVDKSAVKRNRIRRRIYEIIRMQKDNFKGPAELVITVRDPNCSSMPAADLEKAVIELLEKARLL